MLERDSRVARILRDARAAVHAPLRPETPRDVNVVARPARLQLLRRNSLPADKTADDIEAPLLSTVDAIRNSDDPLVAEEAIDNLSKMITDGQADLPQLRKVGAVDALLRCMESAQAPVSTIIAGLACLRNCESIPSFNSVLYTSGALPVIRTLLTASNVNPAMAGGSLLLLKQLSGAFSHAFSKFQLGTIILDQLRIFGQNEVVVATAIGTLAKLCATDEGVEELRNAPNSVPIIASLFDGAFVYVASRVCFILTQLLDDDAVSGFVKRQSEFCDRLLKTVESRSQTPSFALHGFDIFAMRILTKLSANEKFARRFGAQSLTVVTALAFNASGQGNDVLTLVLMCLSNLTFFGEWPLGDGTPQMMEAIVGILFSGDTEQVVEATRALGNISHEESGKLQCVHHRIHEVLAVLATHSDDRVAFNAVGGLINLSLVNDAEVRAASRQAVAACQQHTNPEILELLEKLQQNLSC